MARGDLLFYIGQSTYLPDRIIRWWTDSPFTHVAIDVGDGQLIHATGTGIVKQAQYPAPHVRWRFAENVPTTDADDLDDSVRWLESTVGYPYGYSDIQTAFFAKFRVPFYIVQHQRFHCSALATQFLAFADGLEVLGPLATDPHRVTPGDLARQLGVAVP